MSRHSAALERVAAVRENTSDRMLELEHKGKILVIRRGDSGLVLSNPHTHSAVEFYPTRGTIVRSGVKQFRRGLDHALKLIGVRP